MARNRILAVAASLALLALASFNAYASWQGTWHYYDEEGVLVGGWTAGCGAADGRWGVTTTRKVFTQGCRDAS
ncbi:DUF6289 family protein [Pseudoxanthomonas sp.]|uniref:DUF6289 family protein n=1 Tax=Pseudoxanthomonas sp. TaxID=1871049 RepID=UPI003F7D7124